MTLRLAIGLAVVMLQLNPGFARSVDRAPDPYWRGQIEDFYKNPYLYDDRYVDRLGWAMIVDQRIWNGDEWLPLASRRGGDFYRKIEQEIRDGAVDAE